MKNSALQQSLVELEESLKNLESARTQVENLSGKVEQVTLASTKILAQIELLNKEFTKEQGYYKEIIKDGFEAFNTALQEKQTILTNLIDTLSKNLNDSITNNTTTVGETTELLKLFQKFIASTIETIRTLDFEKRLSEIQNQLANQEKYQKRNFLISTATIIIGFAIVAAIIFIVK